jgi:hypothetical protein
MAGSRRCQGCGAPEGAERTVTHKRKPMIIIIRLEPANLADFGTRLLCQRCIEHTYRLNSYFARQHYRTGPP